MSGVVGSITPKEERAFKDLLTFNTVRGEDSTGVASIPRYEADEVKVKKVVGPASDLIRSRDFDRFMSGSHATLFGHNRSATTGSISFKNTHPFTFTNTVGMHNGTLDYQSKTRLPGSFPTDSETIIHSIDKDGPQETLKKLEGSWTLVWYDTKTHAVYMVRNEKRPLTYTISEDEQTMFFASEGDLLQAALRRNDIKYGKVCLLSENSLYTWRIPPYGQKLSAPDREVAKAFERPPIQHPTHTKGHLWTVGKDGTKTYTRGGSHSSIVPPTSGNYHDLKNQQTGLVTGKTSTPSDQKVIPFRSDGPTIKVDQEPEFVGMFSYVDKPFYKVLRDPKTMRWIEATYHRGLTFWDRKYTMTAPNSLGFRQLNMNSNHVFKHVGRKKNKKIYYKGFNGKLIDEAQFETYMNYGCSSCSRQPEWGNEVTFFNNEHDFLCEYCALNGDITSQFKAVYDVPKKETVANAQSATA